MNEWHDALFVRISAEEYAEGGNHIEDYVYYSELLKGLGVDAVHASFGGVVMVPIHDAPGYQVSFAEKMRQEVGIPTIAVGKITTPEQAEEILQKGQVTWFLKT